MKATTLLYAIPVLCLTSCFSGGKATTTDDANDAAGTGDPYLAREVTGVWMLSTDYKYDVRANSMSETFIRNIFKISEDVALEKVDTQNGFAFKSSEGTIGVSFGGPKPFPSIYHAEYVFDKLYQPKQLALTTGQSTAGEKKPPYTGPMPQGTGAEVPAVTPPGPKRDSSALNDTATTVSGITPRATQFTEPVQSQAGFVAVPGLGDKAVWDPAKKTLHVLYNNHIVNIMVQMPGNQQQLQQRARMLAAVLLSTFTDTEDEITA